MILCTEVLEHVPDPVRSFKKMARLLKPEGHMIVTVPFMSLMHQAPYWFQSGLSPFWFEHWARELNLKILNLDVQGDYADFMYQEIRRLFGTKSENIQSSAAQEQINRFIENISSKSIRANLSDDVLESGGFCTLFVAKKSG